MSIQGLGSTQTTPQNHRAAAGQTGPSGASFQDRLARTAASAAGNPQAEAALNRNAFAKNNLLSALSDFKTTLVDRMKAGKEKQEEEDAWNKLMQYLDAWIESLRDGSGDIEKISRTYASLQADMKDAETGRKDLGDYLLDQLTKHISE